MPHKLHFKVRYRSLGLTDWPRTIFMALVSFGMEPQRYRTEPRTPGLEPERKEGGVAVMAVLFRRLPAFYRSLTGQCSRLPCLSINQAINQSVCRSMMNSHLPSPHSRLHSFHNVHPPPPPTHIAVLNSQGRFSAMARSYETLEVTKPAEWVVQVQLNRPEKSNAMNRTFWR